MYNFKMNKKSPFSPGTFVKGSYLVGRENELNMVLRHIPDILNGNNRHFYFVGHKGMGKSSLAYNIKLLLERQAGMIVLHVNCNKVYSLDELIIRILEVLIEEIQTSKWAEDVVKGFEEYIEHTGLFGLSVKLNYDEKEQLGYILRHFASFIREFCQIMKNNKDGLMIILDNVDNLACEDFANWYKSFATKLDSYIDEKIPVGFVLTSYPQNFNRLKSLNPSFTRIFNYIEFNRLSDEDVRLFYETVFSDNGISIDERALELIVKYSYGMPLMMQEIGYSVYWLCDENKRVSTGIALDGIKIAEKNILNKYLDDTIYDVKYEPITRILSTFVTPVENDRIVINDIKRDLLDEEKDLLDVFIVEAENAGIIVKLKNKVDETYEFINPLYTIFLKIRLI